MQISLCNFTVLQYLLLAFFFGVGVFFFGLGAGFAFGLGVVFSFFSFLGFGVTLAFFLGGATWNIDYNRLNIQ